MAFRYSSDNSRVELVNMGSPYVEVLRRLNMPVKEYEMVLQPIESVG